MFMDLHFHRSVGSSVWTTLPFSRFSATNLMRLEMYDVFLTAFLQNSLASCINFKSQVDHFLSQITSVIIIIISLQFIVRLRRTSPCPDICTSSVVRDLRIIFMRKHNTCSQISENLKQTSPIPVVLNDVLWLKIGFERNTRDLYFESWQYLHLVLQEGGIRSTPSFCRGLRITLSKGYTVVKKICLPHFFRSPATN